MADSVDPHKGITHPGSLFTRVLRSAALEMTEMTSTEASQKFCGALNIGYQCQGATLHRGNKNEFSVTINMFVWGFNQGWPRME